MKNKIWGIFLIAFMLLVSGCAQYEKDKIQKVLDKQCEGFKKADLNLVMSTLDPSLVNMNSPDYLSAVQLFSKSNVQLCNYKISDISFNDDETSATVTVIVDYKEIAQNGYPVELYGKSTTTFFKKINGEWKATSYGIR
jgi:hypothetical protein